MGSKVVSTGSSHSRLINRYNSSIRVSNKSSIRSINSTINSLGSKMVSTCSSNCRFINRNNSSIGMSNKLCVQVERTSIAVTNSSNGSSSNSGKSSNNWGSNDRGRGSIFSSLGIKMCCSGSGNSWFIKRNNSSVRMSNELSVQVKGTSIAVGSGISWGISSISCSKRSSCSIAIASTISSISCSNRSSCNKGSSSSIAKTSIPIPRTIPSISIASSISWSITSISQTCSKFGSKMVSTGSSNCWLINRSHSSVRVGLQTIETLGRAYGHTGSENQKLHIRNRM